MMYRYSSHCNFAVWAPFVPCFSSLALISDRHKWMRSKHMFKVLSFTGYFCSFFFVQGKRLFDVLFAFLYTTRTDRKMGSLLEYTLQNGS